MVFLARRLARELSIFLLLLGTISAENVCEINGACGDDKCGLYLAPSTIPNAGLGIFTAKPLEAGDTIGNGDIAIPLPDINWHHGGGRGG